VICLGKLYWAGRTHRRRDMGKT